MPATFVYWMNVSLDLRIERDPDESGGGDWMRITEPLHREFNRLAGELEMSIEGRTIYEAMEAYWPQAREDASLPDFLREYGEIWTSARKVLVSRTRTAADHNTRVVGGDDAIAELAEIRATGTGRIGVGGATLASQLVRAGLVDELLLFTHPVVLGTGRPLFDDGVGQVEGDLLEQASFPDGVTMHRYAVRPSPPRPTVQ